MEFNTVIEVTTTDLAYPVLNFEVSYPSRNSSLSRTSNDRFEEDNSEEYQPYEEERNFTQSDFRVGTSGYEKREDRRAETSVEFEQFNSGKSLSSLTSSITHNETFAEKKRSEYEEEDTSYLRHSTKTKKRVPSVNNILSVKEIPLLIPKKRSTDDSRLWKHRSSKSFQVPTVRTKNSSIIKSKILVKEIERLKTSESQLKQRVAGLESLAEDLRSEKKAIADTYSSMLKEYAGINELDKQIIRLNYEKKSREDSVRKLGEYVGRILNSSGDSFHNAKLSRRELLVSELGDNYFEQTPSFSKMFANGPESGDRW